MANIYPQNQLPNKLVAKHNQARLAQTEWQHIQNTRWFDNPNITEPCIMPYTQTPPIFPCNSMNLAENYTQTEAELEHLLDDWNASQLLFNNDWGETQMTHIEHDSNPTLNNIYPTTENFWPLANLEIDSMLYDFFPQNTLPESTFCAPSAPSLPQPSVPSSFAATSYQLDFLYAPTELVAKSLSNASPTSDTTYTCSACSKTFPKQHLLKYVRFSLFALQVR